MFDVQYPAPGNPQLASEITGAIHKTTVKQDLEWGLDHGTWSVLKKMYPLANIPVLQMSIDFYQTGNYHYELAKELTFLRSKGVLIVGSGNIVHNLGMVNWNMPDGGYDWAIEFNEWVKKNIRQNEHDPLKNYKNLGTAAQLAVPTPDHYFPLLYILGLQQKDEKVTFFNDSALMGSLTMTSVMLGEF